MMQDFPKELPTEANVGFTQFEVWSAYSPVKNSPTAAAQKFREGTHPQSGTTGETGLYAANCSTLRLAGATVGDPVKRTFNGIDVDLSPASSGPHSGHSASEAFARGSQPTRPP